MIVALLGIAPLHALGLEAIVSRVGHEHNVICSSETDELWRQADCFIVSASALATYAGFLMPRLSRVLLLTHSVPMRPGQGLPCISPLDTEARLYKAVESLLHVATANEAPDTVPLRHSASVATANPLTTREMDVLRLTVRGASAKEMATELGISVNTVLTHRKNISDKLGVHGAPALVYYAMTHRLV